MKNTKLLVWYLIFCCQILIIAVGEYFNFSNTVWYNDNTKLSFVIVGLWIISSGFIGYWHTLADQTQIKKYCDLGWYAAETCLALGMIGTVAGFLMMLGAAFADIDVTNTVNLQKTLAEMASGMSTALYTTLIGLIANTFIKLQLVNLEHYSNG